MTTNGRSDGDDRDRGVRQVVTQAVPQASAPYGSGASPPPPERPPVSLSLGDAPSGGDTRRMAPIYIGVIALEAVVLLSIWWFQQHFGS